MTTIGKLIPRSKDDFWAELSGSIHTLAFQADIRIRRSQTASRDATAPSHRVAVRGPQGDFVEIGAAWSKSMKRGANSGDEFLSVTLDDPSFPHPINFAVFRDEDTALATWRRRQVEAA